MSQQLPYANSIGRPELETSNAATSIRLNSLREAALTILGELDSLRISSAPSLNDGSCSLRLYDEVRKFEVNLIRSALSRTNGCQTDAARLLGVKLTTLNSKIKRYHIDQFEYPVPDAELSTDSAA